METIYWIQRLGTIHTIAWAFFWITLAVAIIGFFIICGTMSEWYDIGYDKKEKKIKKTIKRILTTLTCVVCLSLIIGIFVPTTSELYAIYGIGGTIDYIKSNDTAKQLPDKVINALDAWIDNQTENNNQDK